MRRDESAAVDRGSYRDAVTPWETRTWREAALAWVEGELAARGLREAGGRAVRLRPWSVLVRIPVEGHGVVFFKASPPASAFEAGLTESLARWIPGRVLEPIAVDAERGWSLLPDGGPLFRDQLNRGAAGPAEWEEMLRQYAQAQRELTPYVGRMESLGVPDGRVAALPEIFDRMVEDNSVLAQADRAALRDIRPRLAEWCAELAGFGIAETLDHGDLHDGQSFVPEPGRFVFFDWGDAALAHPFCGLLIPGRVVRERYGPEALPRLRDAYLEPWTGTCHTPSELRRAVSLGWRLGAIGRACSWARLFPGAARGAGDLGFVDGARWLRELLTEPPL
ncbi:aminoglycoside phosphotransferase family protein [Streptomyces sp. NBC_00247]|uniref:aminoglycoside phosphotransferase family protein n=1 Tax=Streptomyces sp. NBC_00247 TaxID=2975689 RepID=UPI002E2D0CC1|nr:aminoglycoside phosphotransferase family protein [Streptomyces sp. NBC_00247]